MLILFDFAVNPDNISSWNSFVENKHIQSFTAQWLLYVPSGSKLKKKNYVLPTQYYFTVLRTRILYFTALTNLCS